MPNSEKVSAGAQGASTATANARKRVIKPIYKVSLQALGTWSDDYRGGVYISDIFEAQSREEAIGMACDNVKAHFPQHAIVAGKINVSLLTPLAL